MPLSNEDILALKAEFDIETIQIASLLAKVKGCMMWLPDCPAKDILNKTLAEVFLFASKNMIPEKVISASKKIMDIALADVLATHDLNHAKNPNTPPAN